tara:strand:+ start:1086 stop:1616 length:531 start_codon:yes stop_codon:yes gene_type:complete
MKIKAGDKLDNIKLKSIDNEDFELNKLSGKKILLSFYRFAACPMCNLRLNEINKVYGDFGKNFIHVAIFDSKLENLKRFTSKHNAPFPILADENYEYFEKYDVEKSLLRFLWSQIIRANRQFMGYFKGYLPIAFKGSITTMPVDILINEKGIVEKVKYAKDLSDHIPLKEVISFSK